MPVNPDATTFQTHFIWAQKPMHARARSILTLRFYGVRPFVLQ